MKVTKNSDGSRNTPAMTLTLYRAPASHSAPEFSRQDWRWRLKTINGRIVGASSESYRDRSDCIRNAETVIGFPVGDFIRHGSHLNVYQVAIPPRTVGFPSAGNSYTLTPAVPDLQ